MCKMVAYAAVHNIQTRRGSDFVIPLSNFEKTCAGLHTHINAHSARAWGDLAMLSHIVRILIVEFHFHTLSGGVLHSLAAHVRSCSVHSVTFFHNCSHFDSWNVLSRLFTGMLQLQKAGAHIDTFQYVSVFRLNARSLKFALS